MLDFKEEANINETGECRGQLKYKALANSIRKKLKKISSIMDDISLYIESGYTSFADESSVKLVEEGIMLSDSIKRFASAIGSNPDTSISRIAIPVSVTMEENDTCSIKFGQLLPHKPKRGCKVKDNNDICNAYLEGFYKEMQKFKDIPEYTEPVVICFIHHYKSERDMVDHDNYDIKPFIDAICVKFLHDDGPKWCSYYMDYVMDNASFSEIKIIKKLSKFA